MKIGFFEIEVSEKKLFKKAFPHDKLYFTKDRLTHHNAKKFQNLDVVVVFIKSKIDFLILEKLPHLKYIVTRSTGFNHINLDECKKRKIIISNVPFYGENTVAEHAFSLILALSRKIVDSVNKTRNEHYGLKNLRGFDLKGKILGVIGSGSIGLNSIKIGLGFGMKVISFDVYKNLKISKKLGFSYVSLNKLLSEADVITIHVPLNKHTYHLLNHKNIPLMKKNSLLINTARGELIETAALLRALKNRKISGVGLDVLENEHDLMDKIKDLDKKQKKMLKLNRELLKRKNVLFTPHNAFNTNEALMRIFDTTIKNIKSFKKNKIINKI